MARANKYTSLNFNDIYEKRTTTTSTSSRPHSSSSPSGSNKTVISNSRIHGHMLVLSRPTPKPVSIPQPIQQQQPKLPSPPPTTAESDSISLRPQGRTGSGPTTTLPVNPPSPLQSPLPKSNRFVPPHLRPGFVGREEKPDQDNNIGPNRQGLIGSYGENGRPKSGGGYERMRRGFGEADPVDFANRPGSSGPRPSSSG